MKLYEILLFLPKEKRNFLIDSLSPRLLSKLLHEINSSPPAQSQSLSDRIGIHASNLAGRPAAGAAVGAGVGALGALGVWGVKRLALSRKLKACTTSECRAKVNDEIARLKKTALAVGATAAAVGAGAGFGGLAASNIAKDRQIAAKDRGIDTVLRQGTQAVRRVGKEGIKLGDAAKQAIASTKTTPPTSGGSAQASAPRVQPTTAANRPVQASVVRSVRASAPAQASKLPVPPSQSAKPTPSQTSKSSTPAPKVAPTPSAPTQSSNEIAARTTGADAQAARDRAALQHSLKPTTQTSKPSVAGAPAQKQPTPQVSSTEPPIASANSNDAYMAGYHSGKSAGKAEPKRGTVGSALDRGLGTIGRTLRPVGAGAAEFGRSVRDTTLGDIGGRNERVV